MPPSALQGLNIVHPTQPLSPSEPPYPDLDAQLGIWTHLPFESDEPFIPTLSPVSRDVDDSSIAVHEPPHQAISSRPPSLLLPRPPQPLSFPAEHEQFDIDKFLAGFGIDSSALSSLDPHTITPATISTAPSTTPSSPSESAPPLKRPRSQKDAGDDGASVSQAEDRFTGPRAFPDPNPNTNTPPSANEDKRRRNTAASARFRLKKKEREAAMEKKSKELEGRVGELERECEALRRENGWLKGLVVGVTGASTTTAASANSNSKKRSLGTDDSTA
ncbi:hypothetical protein SISNIDRAFT_462517 [Sistotremastrum niveocremeum HHB9708]|uniref:BZIP domain-containing protein n=1 Tax=Sistotremastrum niveocremeum HHB9708 TaxID=1314777 RepID=A0A165A8R4_9AGAM|nr:hypothetical protein SISNIDRAFT_462517 [Sistotremastrum niveocremeum HHB9708]